MSPDDFYEPTLKIRAEVGDAEISAPNGEELATKLDLLPFKKYMPSHYIS